MLLVRLLVGSFRSALAYTASPLSTALPSPPLAIPTPSLPEESQPPLAAPAHEVGAMARVASERDGVRLNGVICIHYFSSQSMCVSCFSFIPVSGCSLASPLPPSSLFLAPRVVPYLLRHVSAAPFFATSRCPPCPLLFRWSMLVVKATQVPSGTKPWCEKNQHTIRYFLW